MTVKKQKAEAKPAEEQQTPRRREDEFPMMSVKALEGNQMTPGKVYRVGEPNGKVLIAHKKAIKAKANEEVGEIYDYPKTEQLTD